MKFKYWLIRGNILVKCETHRKTIFNDLTKGDSEVTIKNINVIFVNLKGSRELNSNIKLAFCIILVELKLKVWFFSEQCLAMADLLVSSFRMHNLCFFKRNFN